MTATQSLRLYELTIEFINDKEKAKEFVSRIEATVDEKFNEKEKILATKQDLSEAKVDIIKWQVGTAIAIIGILIAILKLL